MKRLVRVLFGGSVMERVEKRRITASKSTANKRLAVSEAFVEHGNCSESVALLVWMLQDYDLRGGGEWFSRN